MQNKFSRRYFLSSVTASAVLAMAVPALALTTQQAKSLIDNLVTEINAVINSGRSERQMYADFERIFGVYADVSTIARSTLGPDARRASPAQMKAYTAAFASYIARKYGKRFREFIGGRIQVNTAHQLKSFYEVKTTAILNGEAPFDVTFLVSDRSGRDLFFDMLIEGISLLKSEKSEIGSMLDRRRGDIDGMIADLRKAG
jgi:phospholipid transport system substrate-binding protein